MIEKILERLEELKKCNLCKDMNCSECEHRYHSDNCDENYQKLLLDKCKAIVQEVAKDGGWIPCSERLPEKYRICWITWKIDGYSEEVYRATCYKWGWFCIDTQEEFEPHEVVAWKYYEKPAPYQKGE